MLLGDVSKSQSNSTFINDKFDESGTFVFGRALTGWLLEQRRCPLTHTFCFMTSQAACARYPKGRAAAGGGGAVVGGAVRGHDMDIPWSRVAATPRVPRG